MTSPTAIQTFTGVFFDPISPDPKLIRIEDIAHALSLQCRFSGHTSRHYSVAEHSLRVAWLCPEELRLEGLLHDASEAYLVDLPSPMKRSAYLQGYRDLEANVELAIAGKFNLRYTWIEPIKHADNLMLWAEAEALTRGTEHWHDSDRHSLAANPLCQPGRIADLAADVKGRPFSSHGAERAFLAFFEAYKR